MAKKSTPTINVTCPCCQAKLVVDAELAMVLSHEAPPKPAPNVDLSDTARLLREQEERREEKYKQSIEYEKKKSDVFDRLFEEGLKKAKDKPVEKPIRDFDLD
jgi:Zn-finger nucleic acid-binding protein